MLLSTVKRRMRARVGVDEDAAVAVAVGMMCAFGAFYVCLHTLGDCYEMRMK